MREKNEDIVIKRSPSDKKKNKKNNAMGFAVLVLIFVMVICAAAVRFSGISATELDKNKTYGNIIYDSLPDSIDNIEKYSSGTAMLTDTSLDYLDASGERIASNSHLYSQPVIDVKNTTVLLFDKGGTSFRIEKGTNIYNSFTVNNPIVTASIGKKGNYAYVLNEDGGYQSHLYVYTLQGNKQFEWGSAQDYCITTALSDNGRNIAVALLGVENGEYVSKVNFFSFRDEAASYSIKLSDCTVFRLEFINNKTVAALTDNGVFVIDKNGEYEKVSDYSPSEILHSACAFHGLKAIAAAQHGNVKDTQVSVFNKKFEELYTLDFDSEVFAVRASDKYIAVLLSDSILMYGTDGTMTGKVIFDEKCVDASFSGNTLYVLTVSGIYSFNVRESYDLSAEAQENTTQEPQSTAETTTELSDIQAYG